MIRRGMKLDTTAAPKSHEQLDAKSLDKQKVVMTLIKYPRVCPHECLVSLNLHLTFMVQYILYSLNL